MAATSKSSCSSSSGDDESSYLEGVIKNAETRGSADGDSSSTSSESIRSKNKDDDEDGSSDSSSDDDDDDDSRGEYEQQNNDNDEQQLSLAERIQRQQERGVDLRDRRQRQQKARTLAAARLVRRVDSKPSKATVVKKVKKSKHAPTEVSSKRADFYKRRFDLNENGIGVEIGKHRYKPVDPRVSNLTGHLDLDHFETNYEFLQEMRQKEISLLRKRISARKTTGRKGTEQRRRLGLINDASTREEDQEALKKLMHEKAEFQRRQVDRAAHRSVKKNMQEKVVEGKGGVYFPKRKELKRLHFEAKLDELRKRGGEKAVEKAVEKRRKKGKSKDAGLLLGDI